MGLYNNQIQMKKLNIISMSQDIFFSWCLLNLIIINIKYVFIKFIIFTRKNIVQQRLIICCLTIKIINKCNYCILNLMYSLLYL